MFLTILIFLIIVYEVFVIINPQFILDYVEKVKVVKTIEDLNQIDQNELKVFLFITAIQFIYLALLIIFLFTGHVLPAIAILAISTLNYFLTEKVKLSHVPKDERIDSIFCIIILLLTLL